MVVYGGVTNAAVNGTQTMYAKPAMLQPTSAITEVKFVMTNGTNIPSGTVMKLYAIS